jgi:hypothetical protein
MNWQMWTAAEETSLKKMWNEGVPAREMAARLGRTQQSVYGRLVKKRKEDPQGFPSRYESPGIPKKPRAMMDYNDMDYLKSADLRFQTLLATHHLPPGQAAEFIAALERRRA